MAALPGLMLSDTVPPLTVSGVGGLADVLDAACAVAGFEPHAAVRTEQAPPH
jgi:hypothetical protein